MMFYKTDKETVGRHGFATFQHAVKSALAFDNARNSRLLASDSYTINNIHPQESNLTDIQTVLIQLTGRFCEHYASDLICVLSELQAFIEPHTIEHDDRHLIAVGIRECGVDGNDYVISRLADTKHGLYQYVYPEKVYRKLLVIDIEERLDNLDADFSGGKMTVRLIDITHDCNHLAAEDDTHG